MLLSYTKDGLVCQYTMGEGRGTEEERRERVMLLSYTKDGLVCQCEMVSPLIHMLGPTIRVLSSGPTPKNISPSSIYLSLLLYIHTYFHGLPLYVQ
jgi:hypothetical protein